MIKPENAAQAFRDFAHDVIKINAETRMKSSYITPDQTTQLRVSEQMLELLWMWYGHYQGITHYGLPVVTQINQIAGCNIVVDSDMEQFGLYARMTWGKTGRFHLIPLFEPLWVKRGNMRGNLCFYLAKAVEWEKVDWSKTSDMSLPPNLPKPIEIKLAQNVDLFSLHDRPQLCFRVYVGEKSTVYSDVEREAARAFYSDRARSLLDAECNYVWEPEISGIFFEDER